MEKSDAIWILELIRERESKTLAERDALSLAIKALKDEKPELKWIIKSKLSTVGKCVNCGEYSDIRDKFCPGCGATMKGAEIETDDSDRV